MSLIEKHADLFTQETLRELVAVERGPCLSLYMPTENKGAETQQNPIRLKNLLRAAEAQLVEQGERAPQARTFLAPAQALLADANFWQYQAAGLALFLQAASLQAYRLPLPFEESLVINQRFHVKPLLPMLRSDGRFYLLTLNQNGVHLYQGSRFSISELALPTDTPKSLAEELQYDQFEPSLQFHTGTGQTNNATGARRAMYFGSGDEGDEARLKEQISRFFRHLDNGVCELVHKEGQTPLVLVGIEYLQGLYREANQYKFLVETGIEKDPAALTPEELHAQAWAIVEPLFQQAQQQATDIYLHLAGTGDPRAAQRLEEIVPAAYYQRVDTLFAPTTPCRWGVFDPAQMTVHLHETQQPGDEDLCDFAVTHTILNGGVVYVVEPGQAPGGHEVAALFRY